MNTADFESRLRSFEPLLGPDAVRQSYGDRGFWASIGTHDLDVQLTRLADLYGTCDATQRRTLRNSLNPAGSWNLVAYVRRMSLRILETNDPRWLISALRIASVENASYDYRDSIVSLVIVRAAAELVSIDPVPYFDEAIAQCDPDMISTFTNARNHRPKDVRDILRAFGPPELTPERGRESG